MKKQKIKFPIKPVAVILIIFLALFFVMGYIWKILSTSDYFRIKEVVVRGQDANIDLSNLRGRNIFALDLNSQARRILQAYPNYSRVRFFRVLPDRVYVDFIKRKPVAYIKLYKNFTIDSTGFLFNAPDDISAADLPVITGLETRIFGPKPGKRYNVRELNLALAILREANSSLAQARYNLKKIDVTNPGDISIIVQVKPGVTNNVMGFINPPSIFEVKLTAENIKDRMRMLSGLIRLAEKDIAHLKYIDLRFDEPVIKLNNVK